MESRIDRTQKPALEYKLTQFRNNVKTCPYKRPDGKKITCGISAGFKSCADIVKVAEEMLKSEQYEANYPCVQYVSTIEELNLKKEVGSQAPLGLDPLF